MYKSPIETIYSELQTQMVQEDENMVMKAIRKVGVTVDKAELIKALQYDRNQYTKGYEDGKNDVLNDILGKIIAEIKEEEKVENIPEDVNMWHYTRALNIALSIIDRYRAESEDKE